jgi:hypothetical protein
MTVSDARIIAEALYRAKPFYRDPAYTLWLQTVSTFLIFAEEANSVIDIDRLGEICNEGEVS